MFYLLYTSTVYRLCTNSHANHCVLYAITPQSPRCGSSPSAARIRQGNGSRQVARHGAPRRHCNHRRMIRLQRAPAAPAAGFLRQRLRRAPPAGKPAPPRHLRRAVLDGACGWRSPAGRLRQRLRRAGELTYRTAAAGEPTYRTAAGGAFGGRVRWRRRDSLPAVAAAAGGRGLGEAGARAWRGGRAAAAVGLSGVVSTVGRRAR